MPTYSQTTDDNQAELASGTPLRPHAERVAGLVQQGVHRSIRTRVDFVSPVADPASGLVLVRVHFANANLRIRPGVKGMVELGAGQAGAAQ